MWVDQVGRNLEREGKRMRIAGQIRPRFPDDSNLIVLWEVSETLLQMGCVFRMEGASRQCVTRGESSGTGAMALNVWISMASGRFSSRLYEVNQPVRWVV